MQETIHPSPITGMIKAPASKSVMQRACAAALLRSGTTFIHNYGKSNDDKAALRLIQDLGATVHYIDGHTLSVSSSGITRNELRNTTLNCGESGLSVRMFTALAALRAEELTITGEGSLRDRPVDFFDQVMPQLGVQVHTQAGRLPLQIKGPLVPKGITIDGSLSSQFLTGLLFAYGASASGVTIKSPDLKSKPYAGLTLNVMAAFGMQVPHNDNFEAFSFEEGKKDSPMADLNFTVEADWSSAAFLLVAGVVAGNIVVAGLDVFSDQADKKILEALQDCGCTLSIQPERIEVSTGVLLPFHFNATHCPDLFPPLVALAAYAKGTSVIEGVSRLIHKESNRAETLKEEFGKLGINISFQEDFMLIEGTGQIAGGRVDSHNDHRIAMACAIAGLKASAPVVIDHAEAIDKSYPDFYQDIRSLSVVPIEK